MYPCRDVTDYRITQTNPNEENAMLENHPCFLRYCKPHHCRIIRYAHPPVPSFSATPK